jgi:DNA-binding XRE family transcriptional regulator
MLRLAKELFFCQRTQARPPPQRQFLNKRTVIHEKLIYLHEMQINMSNKAINRLKAVLAEQGKTNKWLAEKLSKNETTISRWCTNEVQPSMENLVAIAKLLEVDVKELINSTKSTK